MIVPLRFLTVLVALGLGWLSVAAADGWEPLFNGRDLTGWDSYLGAPYEVTSKRYEGNPIGLNRDPHNVFTVVQIDGQPALRISGQDFGIASVGAFENYHLRLQFKWGHSSTHRGPKSCATVGCCIIRWAGRRVGRVFG